MSAASSWWMLGYVIGVIGFGYCVVLLLYYWRWRLMTFPVRYADGRSERLSRHALDGIMHGNPTLFNQLTSLNSGLDEWYMTADFQPWMLRSVTQFWSERQMPLRQRVVRFLRRP